MTAALDCKGKWPNSSRRVSDVGSGGINTNWAGIEEGGRRETQPQPILAPSNYSSIRLAASTGSITYKYKSPCGAEGEEKARFPQGRERLNSVLISIVQ